MKSENITIIGMQWGDEGKGKVVDYFCQNVDIAVRFGGGANAGHTVVTEKGKIILHLLPTGILHPDVKCFIGGGVVCDPAGLTDEIGAVQKQGVDITGRLMIDFSTHLVLPHHKAWDKYLEELDSKKAISTTLRGIGPAYADKADRIGITAGDLLDSRRLRTRVENYVNRKAAQLTAVGDRQLLCPDYLYDYLSSYAESWAKMIGDVTSELKTAMDSRKKILFEGAQGALLDIGLGTYPYVTSSSTNIGGLFSGLGIPPGSQGEVLGVMKAYTTRVGNGPFPSELTDSLGDQIRQKGNEFGSTTGRPRRTGWLDLAIVKRAAYMSGVDGLIVTKLDVLDGLDLINVCVAHQVNGNRYDFPPLHCGFMEKAVPIYETIPGWKDNTSDCRNQNKLPPNAMNYISFIERIVGKPVKYISTGSRTESFIKIT
ncbi:MAG: adenylosuccinate synthase [candidate division Zixibacteria bacterium]|nr:adenylosuccinate synthase [candidate division Zixibacteria bacterium]